MFGTLFRMVILPTLLLPTNGTQLLVHMHTLRLQFLQLIPKNHKLLWLHRQQQGHRRELQILPRSALALILYHPLGIILSRFRLAHFSLEKIAWRG